MIILSCDHAGFDYMQKLMKYFDNQQIEYKYMGPDTYNQEDDYPDFIAPASQEVLKDEEFVEVTTTDLLTVDFAKSVGANSMLRGLRMVSDFEYELQMATMNKCLNDEIETVFIMSSHEYSFLSSSSVKEIARFGGDYSSFVPEVVRLAVEKKMKK